MEDSKPDPQPEAKSAATSEAHKDGNTPTDAKPVPPAANPDQKEAKTTQPSAPPADQQPAAREATQPEPGPDPQIEALVKTQVDARLKSSLDAALETHLEPLLEVNRQLALFLGEQMEAAIELRQSVRAMERLIDADPRRKTKYAAILEEVKSEGDGMKDPHWINRTRGMLTRLKRTGTLGPKSDDGTTQN